MARLGVRSALGVGVMCAWLAAVSGADAASVSGTVSDGTGAALPGGIVVLRGVATGQESRAETPADGRFRFDGVEPGTYLIVVNRAGFSEAARTVEVATADAVLDVPIALELGRLSTEVSVTATRAEREIRQVPLHVETLSREAIEQVNPLSTGDAIAGVANITPVGGGPFGVRPRLRGLDSTRLLVLVDGERLNTARQATDRTGAEVGLVATDAIHRVEIVNGAGTLLYGSDALAGTINVITNEPSLTPERRWIYGVNSFFSTNEGGARGTLTVGMTDPRLAVRVQAGAESYDDYRSGALDVEDTRPFFTTGQLTRQDTIDSNFGFAFRAFPDPFNAPYVRTSRDVPNSGARGAFVNASALVRLGERRTLRVRYQRRQMRDVGFPDFAQPYFFNETALPKSDLDRVSARYEARAITPWLANVSVTAHYQRTERVLTNRFAIQFPAPAAAFFPISVLRLDQVSETGQRVSTPGIDVQAVLTPARNHVLTTGLTFYRDASHDERTTTTTTSLVGQVALINRAPTPVVFPAPVALGPPAIAHPVRVPDASFRDIALFAQDEWKLRPNLSLIGGLRGDFYALKTTATPGYSVDAVIAGATPPIDAATLPDPNGATYARKALTGDLGVVVNPGGAISPFARVGRSFRHPNLEEMLFAGPATAGSIAPNVTVKPERGTNVDAGTTFRAGRVAGGAFVFLNQYQDFIAQDLVRSQTPSGPLVQTTNYADVRIGGVELNANAPILLERGVVTLAASAALLRGTITTGVNPLDGSPLDDTPADNITPAKLLVSARYTEARGRWWAEYGLRAQKGVTRVPVTLAESPFTIAQDLLSLEGFGIHRLGWGVVIGPPRQRLAVTFAVENLTNVFYREQFQFAPARGRTFTIALSAGRF
jgi:hemoglobin/transferrin/lactoferrin receptor protein